MTIQKEQTIEQILYKFIHQAHQSDLRTSSYPKTWCGWTMEVSFGKGSFARIPWIALTAPGMSVSNGYYPVYLYYKDQGILILAFGISETKQYGQNWPSRIFDDHQRIDQKLGKVPRYGDSLIFKQYSVNSEGPHPLLIPVMELSDDLQEILDKYQEATLAARLTSTSTPASLDSMSEQTMFYMEDHLEDFLIKNWQQTQLARKFELILEDDKVKSRQYPTGVGPIDILVRNKYNTSHTVIELKKNQTSDSTFGQVARYMGWVKKHLSDPSVEGLIIAKNINHKLRYAIEGIGADRVKVLTYNIDFRLDNFLAH